MKKRFTEAVEAHEAAVGVDLLLVPQRAWVECRVALESLQCHRIASARDTFQQLVQQHPADASYQIGIAYACAMPFEAARTDQAPDAEAVPGRTACAARLCARSAAGRSVAKLGVALERSGRRADGLAAHRAGHSR